RPAVARAATATAASTAAARLCPRACVRARGDRPRGRRPAAQRRRARRHRRRRPARRGRVGVRPPPLVPHAGLDAADHRRRRLRPPTEPAAEWTVHVIDPDENAMGSAIADIDGDGRRDVVVGRAWYRSELDGTWTRHEYTGIVDDAYPAFRDYTKVSVLDLDGDGRL